MIKYLAYSGISAAGSALASGVRGRRFESAIPDFFCLLNNNKIFIFFNFFSENIDDVQKGFFCFPMPFWTSDWRAAVGVLERQRKNGAIAEARNERPETLKKFADGPILLFFYFWRGVIKIASVYFLLRVCFFNLFLPSMAHR